MNSSASTILLAAAKVSEAASSAVVSVSTPYQISNETIVRVNTDYSSPSLFLVQHTQHN